MKPIQRLFPWALIFSTSLINPASGIKVLILHPFFCGSHVFPLRRIATELVDKGHQVTIVRWLFDRDYEELKHPNITEFVFGINNTDGSVPFYTNEASGKFIVPFDTVWKSHKLSAFPLEGFQIVAAFCRNLFHRQELLDHLRSQSYAVAIVDLLYNECSLALLHQYGIPAIGYWGFTFAGGEAQYTTAFNPPSAIPLPLSFSSAEMNFQMRVYNFFLSLLSHIVMQVHFYVINHEIQRAFPNSPSADVFLANMSGMLINSHPAIDYPRLLPPSFLEVGGIQMRPEIPLPKDIEDFMQSSGNDGVVLLTMGFMFDFHKAPHALVQSFMNAFARLSQKVLIKANGEPPILPPNVKILKWVPQQDVLAHPKTVLFISHCGFHGVMEALYFGVPILGVPVGLDQFDVSLRLVEKGVAIGLGKMPREDEIYDAITELLSNPRYRQNARRISQMLRSEKVTPVDKALWLIEHVAETEGAEHLKISSRHLYLFQYLCLDVIAVLVLCFLLLAYLVWYMFRLMGILFSIACITNQKEKTL